MYAQLRSTHARVITNRLRSCIPKDEQNGVYQLFSLLTFSVQNPSTEYFIRETSHFDLIDIAMEGSRNQAWHVGDEEHEPN
jgi:hypothetical protein